MKYNPYTDNLKTAIFDIETTGLNFASDTIISASFCEEGGFGLRQYFCDDPKAEFLLLTKIAEEFSNLDAVITYNGDKFDIPFVLTRAKKLGVNIDIEKLWSIDIFRMLKKYWMAGKLLPSLSQKSVEKALGLSMERFDEIDGAACISLYNQYLLSGNESFKEKILLHNGDDVRQLGKISESLSFLPFHEIAYDMGYVIKAPSLFSDDYSVIKVGKTEDRGDSFIINAKCPEGLMPLSAFEEYFTLEYDSYSGLGRLVIHAKELEDYLYVDLSTMPVNLDDFSDLSGFTSNYLIIKHQNDVQYKEINRLAAILLEKIIL